MKRNHVPKNLSAEKSKGVDWIGLLQHFGLIIGMLIVLCGESLIQ